MMCDDEARSNTHGLLNLDNMLKPLPLAPTSFWSIDDEQASYFFSFVVGFARHHSVTSDDSHPCR